MNEQDIPININTNKLLDWLVSRRHVGKTWQAIVLKIREKINNAIQDMPAHDVIIQLLTGQHINYFHCLQIVEILRETEADTKNIFGRYGSQRMKDWQEIVNLYEKDNVYLAEVSQMLQRNINYELPSLRRQVTKIESINAELEKKIKEYNKTEGLALKDFATTCSQLGIQGKDIRNELIELVDEIPKIHDEIYRKLKRINPAIDLYTAFHKFLSENQTLDIEVLPLLKYLLTRGNTTYYEYIHGEKPTEIEVPHLKKSDQMKEKTENDGDEIDFGDGDEIDFGDNGDSSEFSNLTNTPSTDDDFEIVSYNDITVEDSGILIKPAGGIAKGLEAFTLLDNPKTRNRIIDDLLELEAFLKLRLLEMTDENDLVSMSQMQNAPILLQTQTLQGVMQMQKTVEEVLDAFTDKKVQHLHHIKHSSKYVDILGESLKQKLTVADKMRNNKVLLEKKIEENWNGRKDTEVIIKRLIQNTKILQKQIQEDISKKYKGRVVKIVGLNL